MNRCQPEFATKLRTPQAGIPCSGLTISRQPESTAVLQLLFDQLLTRPADQPRHATLIDDDPVKSDRPRIQALNTVMKTKYPTVCTLFYWFVGLWHSNLYYFCHCDSSAQQMIRSLARSRLMVLTSRMEGGPMSSVSRSPWGPGAFDQDQWVNCAAGRGLSRVLRNRRRPGTAAPVAGCRKASRISGLDLGPMRCFAERV